MKQELSAMTDCVFVHPSCLGYSDCVVAELMKTDRK